ncbi:Nascent polypeptide-associated complex subunit alpha [Porphyridium purpureum]|uniref:Nascent polypeptide-associated complex subunit alpha n=1 Tax=Porphyridium purpureum TaxID=35688 RepID=A0A5J4YLU5_PORPP|nr:Nascent polypeptide-associated complex subunit alpha [Porphyridium purpureum]|eukprot:POR0073..scf295_9
MTSDEVAAQHEPATVEDVNEDEDVPELEPAAEGEAAAAAGDEEDADERGQSRAEKKSRKALSKLGLKKVDGITRFAVIKNKQTLFVVSKPDVFKSPNSDQYVIFGEAKVEDLSSVAQNAAAGQYKPKEPTAEEEEQGKAADAEEEEDDADVDTTGLKEGDIELVIEQGQCSRAKAVKALRKNDGDVVNAIMELTL